MDPLIPKEPGTGPPRTEMKPNAEPSRAFRTVDVGQTTRSDWRRSWMLLVAGMLLILLVLVVAVFL